MNDSFWKQTHTRPRDSITPGLTAQSLAQSAHMKNTHTLALCHSSLLLTLSRVSVHLIRLTVPSSDAAVHLLRQLGAPNKNKRRAAREAPQAVKCIVGWMSKGVTLNVWERKSCIWSLFWVMFHAQRTQIANKHLISAWLLELYFWIQKRNLLKL